MSDREKVINDQQREIEELEERLAIVLEGQPEIVRKPVVGYEGIYEVDNFGRVFSLDRVKQVDDNGRIYDKPLTGKRMKQHTHTKGYKVVSLTKDGKTKTCFVHRIVAEAFIDNPSNLPMINHKDEDRTNNEVDNLEWCDSRYNMMYGHAREKRRKKLVGRPHSEEHKKKISEGIKRHYAEKHKPDWFCDDGERRGKDDG